MNVNVVYDILEYIYLVSDKNLYLSLVYNFPNFVFKRIHKFRNKLYKIKFLEVTTKKYNFQTIQHKNRYQNIFYLKLDGIDYLNLIIPKMCRFLFINNCYYIDIKNFEFLKRISITNCYITNLEYINFKSEYLELINVKPISKNININDKIDNITIDKDYFIKLPDKLRSLTMYHISSYRPKIVNILTTISNNIPDILYNLHFEKLYYLKIYGRLKIKDFDFTKFKFLKTFINCSGYNLGSSIINCLRLPSSLKKLSMRLIVDRNNTSIIFPKIMSINERSIFDKECLKIYHYNDFTQIKPIFDCLYYLNFKLHFD